MKFDLVFEGGGAKGMIFVGAMEAFAAARHSTARLLGTSAGAITAALLAAGYSTQEMQAAIGEKENGRSVFEKFLETPEQFDDATVEHSMLTAFLRSIDLPLIPEWLEQQADNLIANRLMKLPLYRSLFSFVERGGLYSADHFVTWLRRKFDTGLFQGKPRQFSEMNFSEFFAATGSELTLIAADTSDQRMLIMNRRTTPDCPVVWAVRMSMSIPLIWQDVTWQASWGKYRGKDITGNSVVDGGMLSNFPVELFVSTQPYVMEIMGAKESDRVLGLLIDESQPVPNAPPAPAGNVGLPFDVSALKPARRITQLINTMMQAHDKMAVEALQSMVVRLPAGGYGTTEFDMSDERRLALVNAGRTVMNTFLMPLTLSGASADVQRPLDLATLVDASAQRILDQ